MSCAVSRRVGVDTRFQCLRTNVIESTLLQAEKVKPKIVDVDQEELDNAFRRNQVTAVNALVVSYSDS